MVNDEVLDDYGLSGTEWDLLCLVLERPKIPMRDLVQASGLKEKEFKAQIHALDDLGYVQNTQTAGKPSWVLTRKGRDSIREIRSQSSAACRTAESGEPEPSDAVPPPRQNEGSHISTLFVMASILGFARECENMTGEWLQVLIMLRGRELQTGNDDGLTVSELVAMMGDDYVGSADILEDKIRNRLKRSTRLPVSERWIEEVPTACDCLTITLTEAGRESLDLIRDDLMTRMSRKKG